MADKAQAPASKGGRQEKPQGENKLGRPSQYTPAVGELICARLCDGETLTDICRTPGLPYRQTVNRWRLRYPDFDAAYTRARAVGMESMADDILRIADDDTADLVETVDKHGNRVTAPNHVNVNRARLQVDTRKFLMAKLAPHVYGDRVAVEHSGTVDHTVTLDERERMRRLATFLLEDRDAGALIDGTADELGTDSHPLPASTGRTAEPAAMDEPRATDDV
jgi:hypothetical protein